MSARKEIPFRMPDGSTNWLQPGSREPLPMPEVGVRLAMNWAEVELDLRDPSWQP